MLRLFKRHLVRLHRDERGAMSVEKILILALIALPLLAVLFVFRNKIVGWFQTQSNTLEQNSTSPPNYQ